MSPRTVAAATIQLLVRRLLAVAADLVDIVLRHEVHQAVAVTTSPRLVRRRLAALVDPVDVIVLTTLVLEVLDNLWRELSPPRDELATHDLHMLLEGLEVDVLCHEVGGVLRAEYFAEAQSAFPQGLLEP